jgi:hypothetical protein
VCEARGRHGRDTTSSYPIDESWCGRMAEFGDPEYPFSALPDTGFRQY